MQSSVIQDFLGLEDQVGTWEATWVFGEELEMHHIELNHNVLGCQDLSEPVLTPFQSIPIRNLICLSPSLTSISLYRFRYLRSGSALPISPRYTLDFVVRFLCLPLRTSLS